MSRAHLAIASVLVVLVACGGRKAGRDPDFGNALKSGSVEPPSEPTAEPEPEKTEITATITNAGELYSTINLGDCLVWPSDWAKKHGGSNAWGGWYPANGMTGKVVATSKHCSDSSVTVFIIDFGDDHFAALNNKGLSFSKGAAPAAAPVAPKGGPAVKIVSAGKVYPMINTGDCLTWPDAMSKANGGTGAWGGWSPKNGDVGLAVAKSKHCSQAVTVIIVKIGDHYVPIDEKGLIYVSGDGDQVPWATGGGSPKPMSTAGAGTVESGRVRLVDVGQVYATINTSTCLEWPDEEMKKLGGSSSWGGWKPKNGDAGVVLGKATHCTSGKIVLFVRVDNHVVPIAKDGVAPE
ncbi:MAG: hypothetical protein HYV09_00805 [Deltaproteobacteria bacterium]|nr:hypothetical protein [Deltaproteobacteria bacterium]